MTTPTRYDWNQIISETFDLLVDSPAGVTLEQIQERNGGLDPHVARLAVQRLRDILGDDSAANIVVKTAGRQRLYVLVGEGVSPGDDGAWLSFNQKYVETRLTTVRTVYKSMLRAIRDEAQAEVCRRLVKNLDRLIEDIAEVHAY